LTKMVKEEILTVFVLVAFALCVIILNLTLTN
jgi:hypothetical protein